MAKLNKDIDAIIARAEELAIEYAKRYKGCAQCTFMAVIDALRWGGLELIPEETEDRFYPGISLLTAGGCMTGEGTCGAVAGGIMAIGLATGAPRGSTDIAAGKKSAVTARDTLMARYYDRFSSILCKDVQRKHFGKAWDLTREDMTEEFLGISEGCTIRQTAIWATEIILEEYEKGNVKLS